MRKKHLRWILIAIPLFVIIMFVVSQNNKLVNVYATVEDAQANVDSQLQRRYDLIPNVVASVQGAMDHENQIFKDITDARKQITASTTDSVTYQNGQIALDEAVGRLLVLVEDSPELSSSQHVLDLITQLEGTENRILIARKDYNAAVSDYNRQIKQFPTSLFAGFLGYERIEPFKASLEATETTPSVTLNSP